MDSVARYYLSLSTFSLILANLIPLAGVLWFHWSLSSVLILFWMENLAIGGVAVLKMRFSRRAGQGKPFVQSRNKTVDPILFFSFHYSMFTLAHGSIIYFLFVTPGQFFDPTLILGFVALLLSHYVSYRTDFIKEKEYLHVKEDDLFWAPYRRVGLLHVVLIVGAFLVQVSGVALAQLLLFIALKIALDLYLHARERVRIQYPSH